MTGARHGGDSEFACEGKRVYSRRAARIAVRNMDRPGVTFYHCSQCHGWHIGNTLGMPNERDQNARKKDRPTQAELLNSEDFRDSP